MREGAKQERERERRRDLVVCLYRCCQPSIPCRECAEHAVHLLKSLFLSLTGPKVKNATMCMCCHVIPITSLPFSLIPPPHPHTHMQHKYMHAHFLSPENTHTHRWSFLSMLVVVCAVRPPPSPFRSGWRSLYIPTSHAPFGETTPHLPLPPLRPIPLLPFTMLPFLLSLSSCLDVHLPIFCWPWL